MSKQTPRQASKQGQSTNKRPNNLSIKQTGSANKPPTRQAVRQDRRQEERQRRLEEQRRAVRRKRILIGSLVGAAVVLVAAAILFAYNANAHQSTAQGQSTSSEQVVNPAYPPVDGIYCDTLEQTAYHIHAHLTIWIDGSPVQIPQGIGIASDQSCFYWLHTHTSDGVVHIEFPSHGSPTLGNFLDIWGQEFSQLGYHNELASTAGWKVYVDGKQVNSNFNQLVLQEHMVITIAYNSPHITPDTSFNWPAGE
jgi:hypothetical protein